MTTGSDAVDALMAGLDHPYETEIAAVRTALRGLSPEVSELVKWNAPNFALPARDFATLHLRAKDGVAVILHCGVKTGDRLPDPAAIPDPEGLVKWLAKDRAMVSLGKGEALTARLPALAAIARAWIAQL